MHEHKLDWSYENSFAFRELMRIVGHINVCIIYVEVTNKSEGKSKKEKKEQKIKKQFEKEGFMIYKYYLTNIVTNV